MKQTEWAHRLLSSGTMAEWGGFFLLLFISSAQGCLKHARCFPIINNRQLPFTLWNVLVFKKSTSGDSERKLWPLKVPLFESVFYPDAQVLLFEQFSIKRIHFLPWGAFSNLFFWASQEHCTSQRLCNMLLSLTDKIKIQMTYVWEGWAKTESSGNWRTFFLFNSLFLTTISFRVNGGCFTAMVAVLEKNAGRPQPCVTKF